MRRERIKKTPEALRAELEQDLLAGRLTLEEALRRMRKIQGKTQLQYARELGIASRTYLELERGIGNPRLETLEKAAAPFGFRVVFFPGKPR